MDECQEYLMNSSLRGVSFNKLYSVENATIPTNLKNSLNLICPGLVQQTIKRRYEFLLRHYRRSGEVHKTGSRDRRHRVP